MKPHNEWTVNPLLFGSFSEEHWGDITPGIYEQYVVNPSFEDWYIKTGNDGNPEEKSNLVWRNIPKTDGLAYPWEYCSQNGTAKLEQSSDSFNTHKSQMVCLPSHDTALVYQRLALPFYRVKTYNVSFFAKSSGDVSLKTIMTTNNTDDRVAETLITGLSKEWKRFNITLELSRQKELHISRYGIFNLGFEISGTGSLNIDLVTLFPTDCIDGVFNPETISHFKNYGPTMLRWPGGNFTSGYHWYDGIGRFENRLSLPNLAWGGLCTNHVGIDEFMRFCELTDIIPVMGVGYNENEISSKEIAEWVEYCNGPVSSEYGAKRAANGHPEPYDVKYWGIGNEVYGTYQQGHVSASEYAAGLYSIASKIKSVDNDVIIMASGRGVHNHYRGAYSGWTEYLSSSTSFDVLDCHLYVYGYDKSTALSLTGEGFFRIYAAASQNLRDFIDEMRVVVPGRKLAFLEWGVLPKLSGKNNPTPQRQTFANLLLSACQYHEMIRNSDIVEMAAMHNFSFYVAPHKLHSEPVNIRTSLFKELSVVSGGYNLKIDEGSFPTYAQTADMPDVGIRQEVPEVDMIAVLKYDCIYVSCVNKNPSKEYSLELNLKGVDVCDITGRTYTSSRPYARSLWSDNVITSIAPVNISESGEIILPPLSYSIFQIQVK